MKLLVSALESSANLHLKEIIKDFKIDGIFDKSFGSPLYPSSDFNVMGFSDVLPKILKAKRAIKEMANLSSSCDKVLLIDSPAFNIPLAKEIKKRFPKKEIIYYILPKVWAWREKRAKKVQKYCDKLASIFPFEDRFYEKSIYVGNPLLDEIKLFKEKISKNKKIAFLPGSRRGEIKALMPIFKEVAKEIKEEKLLVIPKHFDEKMIREFYGDIKGFTIIKDTQQALIESDFAFICSGTATLEAALIGTPFVLVYKAKKIDYFLAKRFVKLKYAGLANIILDFYQREPLHKELFQEDVNKKNLLKCYENSNPLLFLEKSLEIREILSHGSRENLIKLIKS